MNDKPRILLLWTLFLSGVLTGLIIAEFIFYIYTNNSFASFANKFRLNGLQPKGLPLQSKKKPHNIFEEYPLDQVTDFVITPQKEGIL